MSVNAVAQYVKTQLNGLETPYLGAITAFVQPPQVGDFSTPEVHIWPLRVHGKRWTMSRGKMGADLLPIPLSGGQRRNTFDLALYVKCAIDTQGPNADAAFPTLIDIILRKLFSIPIVVVIIDPDIAGLTSSLMDIGENYEIEFAPAHFLTDQGLVGADALITLPLIENFQG